MTRAERPHRPSSPAARKPRPELARAIAQTIRDTRHAVMMEVLERDRLAAAGPRPPSPEVIDFCRRMGVGVIPIRPADGSRDFRAEVFHHHHGELVPPPNDDAKVIRWAALRGGRPVAIGTTDLDRLRALESERLAAPAAEIHRDQGRTAGAATATSIVRSRR